MSLEYAPKQGVIVICDFQSGFVPPEMVKRRPAIVISPQITARRGLCTIVPLSTAVPETKMPWHLELPKLRLPRPWDKGPNWVKADMIYAVSWTRLDLIRMGRDLKGRRIYYTTPLPYSDIQDVRRAVLSSLGIATLTKPGDGDR